MMQNLILSELQGNHLYSKREILLKLGLIPEIILPNQRTPAAWDYCNKFYRLLDSAVKQLNKKDVAKIIPVLVDRATKDIISIHAKDINQYDEITKKVCNSIGANSIADVYRKKLENEFWPLIDDAVYKAMGLEQITKKLLVVKIHSQEALPVDKHELIQCVVANVYNNYAHGHKGVIGTERIKINPENCQLYHKELLIAAC